MLRIGIRRYSMRAMIKRERVSLIILCVLKDYEKRLLGYVLRMDLECGV